MAEQPRDVLKEELSRFPDFTFWYGLSFTELISMPNWALRLYAQALPCLLAEYEIIHNRAASFAHMKKSSQREIMADLNRRVREGHVPRKLPKRAVKGILAGIGFAFDDQRTKKPEEKKD